MLTEAEEILTEIADSPSIGREDHERATQFKEKLKQMDISLQESDGLFDDMRQFLEYLQLMQNIIHRENVSKMMSELRQRYTRARGRANQLDPRLNQQLKDIPSLLAKAEKEQGEFRPAYHQVGDLIAKVEKELDDIEQVAAEIKIRPLEEKPPTYEELKERFKQFISQFNGTAKSGTGANEKCLQLQQKNKPQWTGLYQWFQGIYAAVQEMNAIKFDALMKQASEVSSVLHQLEKELEEIQKSSVTQNQVMEAGKTASISAEAQRDKELEEKRSLMEEIELELNTITQHLKEAVPFIEKMPAEGATLLKQRSDSLDRLRNRAKNPELSRQELTALLSDVQKLSNSLKEPMQQVKSVPSQNSFAEELRKFQEQLTALENAASQNELLQTRDFSGRLRNVSTRIEQALRKQRSGSLNLSDVTDIRNRLSDLKHIEINSRYKQQERNDLLLQAL